MTDKKCSVCEKTFTPKKSYYHRCTRCNKPYQTVYLSYEEGKELDNHYELDGYPRG